MPQASNLHRNVKHAAIDAASSGDNELVAAVTGKHITVVNYLMVPTGDVVATFKSGASTDITGAMTLAAGGDDATVIVPGTCMGGLFKTAKGEALNLNLDGAVQVSGHLSYIEEDAR